MSAKEDATKALQERENKRRQSVVKSMIEMPATEKEQPEPIEPIEAAEEQAGDGVIIAPKAKQETRSKRVNLLAKPSTVKEAEKKCKRLGISLNEAMNQFLENWIQQK